MRLRRETGDFQIKVTSGAVNTIRKGLSAEDFVGELVSVDGVYEAVVNASESEGIVTFKSASYTLTYNKTTGGLTVSEGGAGGGSGESGSPGSRVIDVIYVYSEQSQGYVTLLDITFDELADISQSGEEIVLHRLDYDPIRWDTGLTLSWRNATEYRLIFHKVIYSTTYNRYEYNNGAASLTENTEFNKVNLGQFVTYTIS